MAQYIDKSALVAEIQKRFDEYTSSILKHYDPYKEAKAQELSKILIIINTLEVKEVDFEKEWKEYFKYRGDVATVNIKHLAKHLFELGLKTKRE